MEGLETESRGLGMMLQVCEVSALGFLRQPNGCAIGRNPSMLDHINATVRLCLYILGSW